MICFIEESEVGALRLELLRDQCFITTFPFGAECVGIEHFMFNTNTGILYMSLYNLWIDINVLTGLSYVEDNNNEENDIFKQFIILKNIVSEALKWTEFWHCTD